MNKIDTVTIEQFFDRPVAFYPGFVPITGIVGAIFFCQALYWSRRTTIEDGWFYKTRDDWWLETGLKRREQETARRKLRKAKLLEERLSGNPAKLYYRVNYEALKRLIDRIDKYQKELG